MNQEGLIVKKITISVAIIAILLLAAFFWLLSQASPENAPQDVTTIELPDTYEK